jgi:hypothetical protein
MFSGVIPARSIIALVTGTRVPVFVSKTGGGADRGADCGVDGGADDGGGGSSLLSDDVAQAPIETKPMIPQSNRTNSLYFICLSPYQYFTMI